MSFEVFIKLFRTYCFGFMWLPFPNIKDFTSLFPIIAKARFYLSSQTLMTLYYSLVYPFLTYCNVAWSSTYCSNLNCIYLLQKRLVRLITKAHYLANTAPLFSQLKVLDIFSINSFSVATFMYSYHNNLLPSSFHDLFLSNIILDDERGV